MNAVAGRGGYDLNFVSEPPDSLKCLICLSVARLPWQHGKCGRLFCKTCLVRNMKRCPNCREDSPQYFEDNKSKREVQDLLVRCENTIGGCEWIGELRCYEDHRANCLHVFTACPQKCDRKVLKKDLEVHLREECPERHYECPYCNEKGKYQERVTSHLETCLEVPVQCPNEGCIEEMCSTLLNFHMATDCEFQLVECRYKADGCNVQLMRKDLEKHEKDSQFHFQIAMLALRDLKRELKSLKEMMSVSSQAELSTVQDGVKELQSSSKTTKEDMKQLKNQVSQVMSTVKQTIFPTITFKITNFLNEECFTSGPFYSSEQGYKFCVKVYPNESNYVKVCVQLMQGEYDSKLNWPFSGAVTIALLNQRTDSNHHIKVVDYPKESGSRLYKGAKNTAGCNVDRFIHLRHCSEPRGYQGHSKQRKPNPAQYVLSNTAYFRVTATSSNAWLECSPVQDSASGFNSAHTPTKKEAYGRASSPPAIHPALQYLALHAAMNRYDDYDDEYDHFW